MVMIVQSNSPEVTAAVGQGIGQVLRSVPATILLQGNLGTGKTTLSKAIVAGFGIEALVTSPTFTLMNVYTCDERSLYHFDLYRLTDVDELAEIGFDEFVAEGVPMLIEWPDLVMDYPFEHMMMITLSYAEGENCRTVRIETTCPELERVLEGLQ